MLYTNRRKNMMIKLRPTSNSRNRLKIVAVLFLMFFPVFSIFPSERRPDLSCSRQSIQILPELLLKEVESSKQIIFLHTPKTAGTNLDAVASVISQNGEKFHYQRLPVPRVAGRSPNLITSDWIGGLKQLESNPHVLDGISESFFLSGHFPYGLHLYFSKPSKYVTLLRHPLERELSAANFDYQRGYIDAEGFESYLMDQMIDNPQVRMIAGKEYMMGPCTEKTLEKAKENIEKDFLLAAPVEDLDCFIQILESIQGWGSLAYAPMQITREKVTKQLDPVLSNALTQKHQWDLQLYEWVKARWNLWKGLVIIAPKPLASNDSVLTLMPDYLTTRQAVLLSVSDIDSYNLEHRDDELLEHKQKM
ncbi:MAG: hypothetical protein V4489_08630 [Chlamydiota bacterium]